MVVGAPQLVPLKRATWLRLGAAAQNDVVGHERYETPAGAGEGTAGPSALTRVKSSP